MSDISILSRLINGYQRNVDLSQNSLIVGSIKIGSGGSPTEITQTIANNLLNLQNGTDFSTGTNSHTHDGRYKTITQLASTTSGSSGAKQIGVSGTPTNYTPSSNDVQGNLAGIDTALGTATASVAKVKNSATDTTADYLNNKIAVASGLLKSTLNSGANEQLQLAPDTSVLVPQSAVGANSGVAPLDSGGKIPIAYLPNSVLEYKGTWDASTNTPTLANGTGRSGDVYRVSVAGTVNFGAGAISFVVGDYVIYNGSNWEKSHSGADAVTSVNGQSGIVVLTTDNVNEGSINLYYTDSRALSAVATSGLYLRKDGSVAMTGALNMNTHQINNVVDPSSAQDAATKNYVDTAVAGLSSAGTNESFPAGETLAATTLLAVRMALAADAGFVAGRVYKADVDTSVADKFHVIGLVYNAGSTSAGSNTPVYKSGKMTVTGHGLTVGLPFWLAASGAITQTAPTSGSSVANQAVVKLGMVRDANTLEIQIQEIGVI